MAKRGLYLEAKYPSCRVGCGRKERIAGSTDHFRPRAEVLKAWGKGDRQRRSYLGEWEKKVKRVKERFTVLQKAFGKVH